MSAVGRATVGVMGSSRDEHEPLARPLGELIARLELNLLTGGGTVSEIELAVHYGKPVAAFAATARQLRHFPAIAPLAGIADVEAFNRASRRLE